MYDPLTTRYSFACPHGMEARVPLSDFRALERLPGPHHPAVYQVLFACGCGDEHPGLVPHDDLDWAPLGGTSRTTFRNLMTSNESPLAGELVELAALRIKAGEWPWSFYCHLEARPRPMTPSAVTLIAPGEGRGNEFVGIAVHCPACGAVSVNLVTRRHVDVPCSRDARVGVVDHFFEPDALRAIEEFRHELHSARFDERRLDLAA